MMSVVVIGVLSLLNVGTALLVPTFTAELINEGVLGGRIDLLEESIYKMIGVSVITVVTALSGVYMSSYVSAKVSYKMRKQLIERIQELSLTEFKGYGAGTILMRSTRDVEKVQNVLAEGLVLIAPAPLIIVVGLGLTFYKDLYLGCFILSLMILMCVVMKVLETRAIPLVQSLQQKLDKITDLLRDHLIGMSVIRAFNRSAYEVGREVELFTHKADLGMRLARTYALGLPSILLIFNMSTVIILWLGVYGIVDGRIQIGDIMAIIEYATLILLHLIMAIFVLLDVPEAIMCYKRIQELLYGKDVNTSKVDLEREGFSSQNYGYACKENTAHRDLECSEEANHESLILEKVKPVTVSHASEEVLLRCDNVSFCYEGAEAYTLEDISFDLKAGEHLAIMGDIGSGKSTLINVIMGLLPISCGMIMIKGERLTKENGGILRQYIGYVPQKAHLFTGSIRENILYGVEGIEGRTVSEETLDHIAEITRVNEILEKNEAGYDYEITQGGQNLSGGQRQRLALARALLREPQIYILDDSFSALDGITEVAIRQALRDELRKRSGVALISIEQRILSAKQAHKILLLEEGRIVGYGTHEELKESCLVYQQIADSQEVEV